MQGEPFEDPAGLQPTLESFSVAPVEEVLVAAILVSFDQEYFGISGAVVELDDSD